MTRKSRVAKQAAIALVAVCAALLAAEVAVRWAVEGGFGPAVASFQSGDPAGPFEGSRDGLVFDAELGYRPDLEAAPAHILDVPNPASPPTDYPKAAEILFVGGPMPSALASGSEQPDNFAELLRSAFGQRAELTRLSVPGYTTHQVRIWLGRHVPPQPPGLVVVVYTLDDNHAFLYRLEPERGLVMREQARRTLLPGDRGPAGWLAEISYVGLRLHLALSEWRTPPSRRFPWDFDYATGPAWRDETWKPFANELALIKTHTERFGAGLLLLVLPIASQFDPVLIEQDALYVFKPQIKALEVANSLHIAAVDLVPEFQRQNGRTLFEANGFDLNARGHVLVADALKKVILDSGMLPESNR